MKALTAVLLALLLCKRPGRGQTQDGAEDEDLGPESYDEDYEEDEEAEGDSGDSGDRGLRCYTCSSLHKEEACQQTLPCSLSQRFCKALLSRWDTESGPLTTYSGWCTDACKPVARTVEGMAMTMSCCQTSLCNAPPWQGAGPSGPQGSPGTVATALLLSLLLGRGAVGS
ncbi:glycosylphosphatidylinositol-anchored high density lipoprotein-binding protein 1 [Myotis myotis]|uniref:Glycosylphosphatidylinositol anchored high density lipoprotein binding protein 1 n=1 Tax=Myotis myotis TaxID=51298 RepID=A0A7J7TJD7_MYOMY|nr:glycosylphosphatidylinositol-anchored high density lipoprotein-binding protein 1 [Myotis myotis]KAF6300493.1 glycosylphosphatidylinositol anchored high density lipoprotein binding protein 1 [Myotis myotis]